MSNPRNVLLQVNTNFFKLSKNRNGNVEIQYKQEIIELTRRQFIEFSKIALEDLDINFLQRFIELNQKLKGLQK
jgi:hypothetical protein